MTFVIILLVIIVALVVAAVMMYNGLVKQRNTVQEAWHQIDVELTRRHDLIPNLVETVKAYAKHEAGTLDAVIRARGAAVNTNGSPAQVAEAEGELSQALGRLISVSEAYPDLKSNQNYQQLMGELSSTEDRISNARRYYNACVSSLDSKVDSIPTKFMASPAGVTKAEYYEADEATKGAPRVNMTNDQAPNVQFDAPQSQQRPYNEQPQLPPSQMPYPTQNTASGEYQAPGQEGYGVPYPEQRK